MIVCLMLGAVALDLASREFTLSWTHSVEKVEWRETWQVEESQLRLIHVAIKGSGAGMEPADDARLEGEFWVWDPDLTVPALHLAASGATGAGWTLCSGGVCREIGRDAAAPVDVRPCEDGDGRG